MGAEGLERVARACMARTARAGRSALTRVRGVRAALTRPHFHEAVLTLDRPVAPVLEALAARGIEGGLDLSEEYPELGAALLVCATETKSSADIATLRGGAVRGAARRAGGLSRMNCTDARATDLRVFTAGRARRASHWPPQPSERNPVESIPPALRRAQRPLLPEVSELDVVRHYTRLSQLNFSIDTHFYPLGSCTMKYNPKACNAAALLPEFLGAPSARAGGARAGIPGLHVRAAGDAQGRHRHARASH